MGATKHYAGRWICQRPADTCSGFFTIQGYGERVPCPLAGKCLGSGYPSGQLERGWPRGQYGMPLKIQSEEDWNRKHLERRRRALWAFAREEMNDYFSRYAQGHREEKRRAYRKSMPALRDLVPGYVPENAAKEEHPPCGGDCRNCPWETCRYEDWEGPREKKRRIAEPSRKAYRERRKERIKTDPEYAEREREKARAYAAAYRAKVKKAKEERK